MPKRVLSVRCPTCRKLVLQKEPEFPFCSERCRLIDLGKWASGGYVISTPLNEADQYGEAEYPTRRFSNRSAGNQSDHGYFPSEVKREPPNRGGR
jgi:endogenous inhibitor of DNA gyrase (YacG/DUF329 family)